MLMSSSDGGDTHGGVNAFAVVHLVELLLAFIGASVVLPALARNHQRFRRHRASHSLFFSVVLSDWIFAFIGVIHHLTLLGQGGHTRLVHSLGGVVLDALFHLTFVATLLWPPILACFALRNGSPTFFVRINWQFAWLVAGAYGVLWTRALQRDRAASYWDVLRYVLSVLLGCSAAVVLSTAVYLYGRRFGLFRKSEKRDIQEEPLLRYLLFVTGLQFLFALSTWTGSLFPNWLNNIALAIVFLIPSLNAYNYGSQATRAYMHEKRTRSRTGGATHTSVTEELIQSMDPDMVALEELDGLTEITFLAEGASGSVYKARWLGIDVAMKVIKLPNAGDNNDLYQTIIQNSEHAFLEEASICARLRHPNITLFIRAGHYEGKLGILTEFCHRGSLKDVLKKQFPLAWKRKVALAIDIAKGLTYLHARNPTYIHRDLKASNILVTDTWQAKLADFGISKVSNFVRNPDNPDAPSTRTGNFVDGDDPSNFDPNTMTLRTMNESTSFAGTWRWNAPEILKDPTNCRYSRSTDMYSFGMVLWEILSDGEVPFANVRFDFEVRERVITEQRPQIKPSPGCPDAFINLILQCWSQHPSARPTASQAAAELVEILDNMGGKPLLPLESIDSSFDPSLFSHNMGSVRSTFGRITNFFRGHSTRGNSSLSSRGFGSSRGLASSRGLTSSRGFASSRGIFHGGFGALGEDDDDSTNKFAILGSPGSNTSRSTRGSSMVSLQFGSSRRRGFSREMPLPSLYEYGDGENPTSESTAGNSPEEAAMSPIVELPMDAMLEDGGLTTFFDDKPPSVDELDEAAMDRDSELARDVAKRGRGLTFDSVRSGDSVVDASAGIEPEYDELERTQPIKYPTRARFSSRTRREAPQQYEEAREMSRSSTRMVL